MDQANKARQNLQKKLPVVENGFTKTRDQLRHEQEMLEATIQDNQGMSYLERDEYDSEGNRIPLDGPQTFSLRYRSRVLEKLSEPILIQLNENRNAVIAFAILFALIIMLSSLT